MSDLLDANVWIPLCMPSHVHHGRALSFWNGEASGNAYFCRTTALALLRLLTQRAVMGAAALTGTAAWAVYAEWLTRPTVDMLPEPPGVDEVLRHWLVKLDLRGGDWTDAYLAAFAMAAGCRLVTFERGFERFPELDCLVLS